MLIQLAIIGLLAALLPAIIVWSSSDADKYRKLIWVTTFLTFDLIMFGAFTRLTDSGLGCPDWPGCYGEANPFQAMEQIRAAEAAMPTGPVTVMKAWIEMIHRYLAMGVGVLIIGIMAVAWRNWRRLPRPRLDASASRFSPWLPTMLFVFVCIQGAFGAWTVTLKLQPVIVTIHLLLGMTLLGMLAWLGARQLPPPPTETAARSLVLPATVALAVLGVQIALGGWVSTNYAVLACTDYPLCHGTVVPQMDFENGFDLWRKLGQTADGEYLPFQALTAIHWTHRTFALVVLGYIGWFACRLMRVPSLRRNGTWLAVALCAQFALGVATVFLNWPLAIAVMHNGGAALLVLLLVMINYKVRCASASSHAATMRHPVPPAAAAPHR